MEFPWGWPALTETLHGIVSATFLPSAQLALVCSPPVMGTLLSRGSQFYDRIAWTLSKFSRILSPHLPPYSYHLLSQSPGVTQDLPTPCESEFSEVIPSDLIAPVFPTAPHLWAPSCSPTSLLLCRHIYQCALKARSPELDTHSWGQGRTRLLLMSWGFFTSTDTSQVPSSFRVPFWLSACSYFLEGLSLLGGCSLHWGHGPCSVPGWVCLYDLGWVSPAVSTCFLICEMNIIRVPTSYGCHGK